MTFGDPMFLALAFLAVILWLGTKPRTTVGHPSVNLHANIRSIPLAGRLPSVMISLSWIFLAIALARPLLVESNQTESIETRDFIITVDISSSMNSALTAASARVEPVCAAAETTTANDSLTEGGDSETLAGTASSPTKLDVARMAAQAFVDCRDGQGDRIGLIFFGGRAFPVSPLTRDLRVVRNQLSLLGDHRENDTNFDGPTRSNRRIGALQASIEHFDELGEADARVLILITDGEDSIDRERFAELSADFTARGIRVYILAIGDNWMTKSSTQAIRNLMNEIGGTIIQVANADELRNGFAQINELERSTIEVETYVDYQDIYQFFVAAAIAFLALYLIAASLTRQDA